MYMSKIRLLTCCVLTSLACNSTLPADISPETSPVQSEESSIVYGLKLSAAVTLAASIIKFYCTEPNSNPVRYDVEEAKTAIQELKDSVNVQENLNKIRSFIWYFILDGIIGHSMKKSSIRIDPDEPNKLLVHSGAKAKGLYGYIHSNQKCIAGMAAFTSGVLAFVKNYQNGWQSLKNFVFHPIRFINGEFKPSTGPSDAQYIARAINNLNETLRQNGETSGLVSH